MNETSRVRAVYPRFSAVQQPDLYQYRPQAGWRWVQRVCFWLLAKIGAYATTMCKSAEIHIDGAKLSVGLVSRHLSEVRHMGFTPSRLLIGAEDYAELMGDKAVQQALRFHSPLDIRSRDFQIFGIDVTIVPWMRGLLVVPAEMLS